METVHSARMEVIPPPTLAAAEADVRAGRGDPVVLTHRAGALFLVWRDATRAAAAAEEAVSTSQPQRADVVYDAHGNVQYTPSPRALFGSRRTEAHERRVQERLLRGLLDAALAEAGAAAAGLCALVAAEPLIDPLAPDATAEEDAEAAKAKAKGKVAKGRQASVDGLRQLFGASAVGV